MEAKRKKRRRPPRKPLRQLTAEDLMNDAEFRRWRYHAPSSLKRQAHELIKRMAGKKGALVGKWTDRL